MIQSVDGKPVGKMRDLSRAVASHAGRQDDSGRSAARTARAKTVEITVDKLVETGASRARAARAERQRSRSACACSRLDDALRERFELGDVQGVAVVAVDPDGPAARRESSPAT